LALFFELFGTVVLYPSCEPSLVQKAEDDVFPIVVRSGQWKHPALKTQLDIEFSTPQLTTVYCIRRYSGILFWPKIAKGDMPMAKNSLFMIMLLCLMFLAGWILGCRSGVSAATSAPRIEFTTGSYTVQYGDQNKLYTYTFWDSGALGACKVFTATAPGVPPTLEKCK
jgi:hypothetical protein